MSMDIQTYIDRVNGHLQEPGFRGCTIESENPPIAAFIFDTGIDAETYSAKIVLQGANAYIDDRRPNIVLVKL